MKTFIGFLLTGIIVTELAAFIEGAVYINFNFLVPTILKLVGFYG